ncbi:MAG: hypothetical protein ACJAT5_001077 [Lentimonas sp.]|jgi:hypothetical protein
MKPCLYVRFFAFLCLSAVVAHAIPLASAKVLVVEGTASYGLPGAEDTPLAKDTIISEGDSIITGNTGVVHLIFSNGAGLTIEESSNLVFLELEQKPFWKSNPEEYPEEEVSKSTTVLELKYGNVKGHMKGLRDDSEFRIKTQFGDALVAGNLFFLELYFDPFRNEFVFNVQNINGLVDLITKFSGSVKFGRNGMAIKSYDSEADILQVVRIPPTQTFSIRKSRFSPGFRNSVQEFPKDAKSRLILGLDTLEPFPADQRVQDVSVVSPNGTEGTVQ